MKQCCVQTTEYKIAVQGNGHALHVLLCEDLLLSPLPCHSKCVSLRPTNILPQYFPEQEFRFCLAGRFWLMVSHEARVKLLARAGVISRGGWEDRGSASGSSLVTVSRSQKASSHAHTMWAGLGPSPPRLLACS